jgi:aspartyl-tRNA(Asn)/glutamyl-tRNA(Gln) amidotransferase subunit A
MSIVENCVKSIGKAKSLKNLNILIKDTFDLALVQAKQSEQRVLSQKPKSKLDGLVYTVKENFCTKSIETTCASKMLANFVPPYNATVVERLQAAGSCLLGKTNMDEFGMGSVSSSYFGTVKNPYNLIRNSSRVDDNSDEFFISGGSSGGSAASVSAGMAELYLPFFNIIKYFCLTLN